MSSPEEKEKCEFPKLPCMGAYRQEVYDKARICKRRTIKRCKEKPDARKSCEASRVGVSRLTKRQLCSYILKNPLDKFEGHVNVKKFEKGDTLQKNVRESIQRHFFTPFAVEKSTEPKILDATFLVYMSRLTKESTAIYFQKGKWKATWTQWDEDEDVPLNDWTLTFPSQFLAFLRKAKQAEKRHVFLYLREYKKFFENSGEKSISIHANFIHLDLVNKRMYRYEPSGYGLYEVFDMEELDSRLAKWASARGLKYVAPYESCPRQLFAKLAAQQRLAGKAKKIETDPGGFCKTWASFMLELRLRNPDASITEVHDAAVKHFLESNLDLNQFARYYTARVNQMGEAILKQHGMKNGQDPDEFLEKKWKKVMGAKEP